MRLFAILCCRRRKSTNEPFSNSRRQCTSCILFMLHGTAPPTKTTLPPPDRVYFETTFLYSFQAYAWIQQICQFGRRMSKMYLDPLDDRRLCSCVYISLFPNVDFIQCIWILLRDHATSFLHFWSLVDEHENPECIVFSRHAQWFNGSTACCHHHHHRCRCGSQCAKNEANACCAKKFLMETRILTGTL